MVRSNSIRILCALLVMTSCHLSDLAKASGIPANAVGRTIVVNEGAKSAKCTVLKVWQQDDGSGAMVVECVDTGEKLTIVQAGDDVQTGKKMTARIFHWGRSKTQPPEGVPVPPDYKNQTDLASLETATQASSGSAAKKPVVLPDKNLGSLPEVVELTPASSSPTTDLPQISGKSGPSSAVTCPDNNEPLPEIQNKHESKTAGKSFHNRMPWNRNAEKSTPMPVKETQVAANAPATVSTSPYAQPVWSQVAPNPVPKEESVTIPVPMAPPVAAQTKATSPAQPAVVKSEVQDLPPSDWRESWGKLKDSTPAPTGKSEKKAATKTPVVKQTKTTNSTDKPEKVDPLMDPEAYSKTPASEKLVKKFEDMKIDDQKVREALDPKAANRSDSAPKATNKPTAASDLPPDDFRPDAEPAIVTKTNSLPPVPEKKKLPAMPEQDLPPMEAHRVPAAATPPAFIIQTTTEPTNTKSIMAPAGLNSMLYTTPAKEDPSLAPLPFSDKDKINQWVAILKDSIYPSQREWAADQLSACDWHKNLQLVPELMRAAKEDPAATVRAGCIRCLARMNVNTVPVVMAIQGMKKDADPRVQTEAEQALSVLAPDLPMKSEKPDVKSKEEAPMSKEMPTAAEVDLPPSE